MAFIKVTANQSSKQAHGSPRLVSATLYLNIDLIAAVVDKTVILKNGNGIVHGNTQYTDIRLADGVTL